MSWEVFIRRPWGCILPASMVVAVVLGTPGNTSAQDRPPPLDRIVGLELTNVPLREALNQLQRATGASLIYSPDFDAMGGLVEFLSKNCCQGIEVKACCVPQPRAGAAS